MVSSRIYTLYVDNQIRKIVSQDGYPPSIGVGLYDAYSSDWFKFFIDHPSLPGRPCEQHSMTGSGLYRIVNGGWAYAGSHIYSLEPVLLSRQENLKLSSRLGIDEAFYGPRKVLQVTREELLQIVNVVSPGGQLPDRPSTDREKLQFVQELLSIEIPPGSRFRLLVVNQITERIAEDVDDEKSETANR